MQLCANCRAWKLLKNYPQPIPDANAGSAKCYVSHFPLQRLCQEHTESTVKGLDTYHLEGLRVEPCDIASAESIMRRGSGIEEQEWPPTTS